MAEWTVVGGHRFEPRLAARPLIAWPSRGGVCVECLRGEAAWFDSRGRKWGSIGDVRDRVLRVAVTNVGYLLLLSRRLVHVPDEGSGALFDITLDIEHGAFGDASVAYSDGQVWLGTACAEGLTVSRVGPTGGLLYRRRIRGLNYSNVVIVPVQGQDAAVVLLDDGAGCSREYLVEGDGMRPIGAIGECAVVAQGRDSDGCVLFLQDDGGVSSLSIATGLSVRLADGHRAIGDLGRAILCIPAGGPRAGLRILDKRNHALVAVKADEAVVSRVLAAVEHYGAIGGNRHTGEVGLVSTDGAVQTARFETVES